MYCGSGGGGRVKRGPGHVASRGAGLAEISRDCQQIPLYRLPRATTTHHTTTGQRLQSLHDIQGLIRIPIEALKISVMNGNLFS